MLDVHTKQFITINTSLNLLHNHWDRYSGRMLRDLQYGLLWREKLYSKLYEVYFYTLIGSSKRRLRLKKFTPNTKTG